MPSDDSTPRVPQGPVGGYVIAGLAQRRKELGLTFKDINARLAQIGRPIPTLGLSRIERGERRVDADDLVALAVVLEVSPAALLLPQDVDDDDEEIALTERLSAPYAAVRQWLAGQAALPDTELIDWNRPAFIWRTSSSELAKLRRRIELLEGERLIDGAKAYWRQQGLAPAQPVAAAVVTSRKGVLVARRNDGSPPWTFIAGEIEPGESPEDAAIREVKEETGLDVRPGHVIGYRVHPRTGRTMFYLAAKPAHGTKVFVGDESELAEVRWVSLAVADDLLPDMYQPVRDHLAAEIGQ